MTSHENCFRFWRWKVTSPCFLIFWVLSIVPKIPEISVGIQMERSVSVSSDRNIRDHLWRWFTYFGRDIPTEIFRSIFDKPVLCPKRPFSKMAAENSNTLE